MTATKSVPVRSQNAMCRFGPRNEYFENLSPEQNSTQDIIR